MARALKVVACGLGEIGQGVARLVLDTPGLQLVGACDPSPHAAGQDLGSVLGLGRRLRLKVEEDVDRFVKAVSADVALVCTASTLKEVRPLVAALLSRKVNVLSTCEELVYPAPPNRAAFRDLDALAKKKKVAVLSTGVNPGYAMDALALVLTAPCTRVQRVLVTRVVDAGRRRLALQRKVGAGLSLAQFRRAVSEGSVRHVGLVESVHMIADGLGWTLDKVEETLDPSLAPRDLDTGEVRVAAGSVAGVRQTARGYRDGSLAVSLDLQMYVGAESPRDHIVVDGDPPIDVRVAEGFSGDVATAAMVVNTIPRLLGCAPGLHTMRDLPLVHGFNPADLAMRR